MASSVEAIASRIRQVLDQVGAAERAVARGLKLIDQAAATFAQLMRGSDAGEANEIAGRVASARRTLTEARATLAAVTRHLLRYLTVLGVTAPAGRAPSPSPRAAPTTASPERIDALRAQLPPPVIPGSGRKTHGRWMDPNGTEHAIVSGRDDDSAAVGDLLKARGFAARTEPLAVSHAEQKLAAHMVRDKITHATLVINNRPCRGPLSCDTLLPILLPAGYSLTVHAPNYRKTFTGGAGSRWH